MGLGEQGCVAVEVVPADLDHADLGLGEVLDDVVEDVARGEEVGVENGDELAARLLQPRRQRPGLVAGPVVPVDVADRIPLGGPLLAGLAGDVRRVVGAVVQHLNFEPVEGVVDLAGGPDDSLGHRVLVVHRELNRHLGEHLEPALGLVHVVPVLHVEVHQHVPVHPVQGDGHQGADVEGHQDVADQLSRVGHGCCTSAGCPACSSSKRSVDRQAVSRRPARYAGRRTAGRGVSPIHAESAKRRPPGDKGGILNLATTDCQQEPDNSRLSKIRWPTRHIVRVR